MNVRVFVDDSGTTRFEPFDLATMPEAGFATRTLFGQRPPGSMQDWHNAASPMFLITLSGEMEVEIEGSLRQVFGPGDVRLAEDTTGPGHVSRVLGDQPWVFAVLIMDER
jgi:hypothetical protein